MSVSALVPVKRISPQDPQLILQSVKKQQHFLFPRIELDMMTIYTPEQIMLFY